MLLFVYDKLMTKREQKKIDINMEFVTIAQMNGKMFWFNDAKQRRFFAIPSTGVALGLISGALFKIDDYEEIKWKLHGYYNNSEPYVGKTIANDIYALQDVNVMPMKIKAISEIEKCEGKYGNRITVKSFVGNVNNWVVNKLRKQYYHKVKSIDEYSYIEMIKEQYKHE